MKKEFMHPFKSWNNILTTCLVKMWSDDGETFICFINLGNGVSVTNASEQLATEITNEYNLDPRECRFFETYQEYNYDNFDEIEYVWEQSKTENTKNKWNATRPKWKPASIELKKLFTE